MSKATLHRHGSEIHTIECTLRKGVVTGNALIDMGAEFGIYSCRWNTAKRLFPALVTGLRPGQTRNLVVMQTANGIKVERARK